MVCGRVHWVVKDACDAILLVCVLVATTSLGIANAEDWPTYRHDNRRSGVTDEQLNMGALTEQWVYESPAPPQPAWHGPAKWDPYASLKGLRSMRNYDPVFHVSITGASVFFGSSVEDAVFCLDAENGQVRWVRCFDGPVRITPTCFEGKVYAGSDDGFVYCLDAETGAEIWRYSPSEEGRLLPNNGKMISFWPCRTGVLVDGGVAYFGAALLPWKESYLCAVDAETGRIEGEGLYRKVLRDVTIEGAMLASPGKLYVPQGRTAPMVFERKDGSHLGDLEGGGGVFALLTPDHQIAHGPGNKQGWITVSNAESRDKVASYDGGNCMVVVEDTAYVLKNEELVAVNRADGQARWSVATQQPYTLILAGDTLFAGGEDEVAGYAVSDGALRGKVAVKGRAYGLAVADGRLYVSTELGMIHCFK